MGSPRPRSSGSVPPRRIEKVGARYRHPTARRAASATALNGRPAGTPGDPRCARTEGVELPRLIQELDPRGVPQRQHELGRGTPAWSIASTICARRSCSAPTVSPAAGACRRRRERDQPACTSGGYGERDRVTPTEEVVEVVGGVGAVPASSGRGLIRRAYTTPTSSRTCGEHRGVKHPCPRPAPTRPTRTGFTEPVAGFAPQTTHEDRPA